MKATSQTASSSFFNEAFLASSALTGACQNQENIANAALRQGLTGVRRRYDQGFTIVELMISIVILAVLLSLAVPSFRESAANANLRAASSDLGLALNSARAMAISLRSVVVVKPLGTANDWADGWVIDYDTVVPVTGASKERDQEFLPHPGVQVVETSSGLTSVTFNPSGIVTSTATFTVCDVRPGETGRQITIDRLGRLNTEKWSC